MRPVIFRNVRIFDGSGAATFPGEVRVTGNRIDAVARGADAIPGDDCTIVDGRGGTLMPGLIDPHAHLTFTSSVDRIVREFVPASIEEHALITAHNARTLLDYGYTSAFSGGATRPLVEIKVRDEIAAGYIPGPRLKAASFERAVDGSRQDYGAGVAEVEKFCSDMVRLGVDSMKFILSGAKSVIPAHFDELTYSDAELSVASRLARQAGVHLLGHCYNSESIRLAIRHGFRGLFHCNFADAETLDVMEAHRDDFFVVPAVGIIEAGLRRKDEMLDTALELQAEAQVGLELIDRAQREVIPAMRKRGLRVLPGGDYGFAHNPHGRNAWEIELFVKKFGFEPAEALSAATRGGAAMMGMEEELGQVREGFLADLVLVDGDVLNDVSILQDRERIAAVMQNGRFHRRATPPLDH